MGQSVSVKVEKVRSKLLQWTREGKLAAGDKIPPERELAQILNMSHLTVRRGLQTLVDEGIIIKQPGVGSFIKTIDDHVSTPCLALVLPQYLLSDRHKNPAVGRVVDGLTDAIDAREYMISTLKYRHGSFWADAGEVCMQRKVAGMVIWPDFSIAYDELNRLMSAGIKIVMLERVSYLASPELPCVTSDICAILAEALRHLVYLGHKRICVTMYKYCADKTTNLDIITQLASKMNLGPVSDILYEIVNKNDEPDYQPVFRDILKKRPTAVIVPDEVAAKVMFTMCQQSDIKIPQDISLVSLVDNTPRDYPVPLSAPETGKVQVKLAIAAGQLLIKMVEGKEKGVCDINFHSPIHWRQSVIPLSDNASASVIPSHAETY